MMVRLAGVEPATLGLEVRCSIQLSYRRVLEFSRVTARASSEEGSVMPEMSLLKSNSVRRMVSVHPGSSLPATGFNVRYDRSSCLTGD